MKRVVAVLDVLNVLNTFITLGHQYHENALCTSLHYPLLHLSGTQVKETPPNIYAIYGES